MTIPRHAMVAVVALTALAFLAPAASATLVDRTVFAEDFGWNT